MPASRVDASSPTSKRTSFAPTLASTCSEPASRSELASAAPSSRTHRDHVPPLSHLMSLPQNPSGWFAQAFGLDGGSQARIVKNTASAAMPERVSTAERPGSPARLTEAPSRRAWGSAPTPPPAGRPCCDREQCHPRHPQPHRRRSAPIPEWMTSRECCRRSPQTVACRIRPGTTTGKRRHPGPRRRRRRSDQGSPI